jgi:hypothetical protein
VNLLLVFLLLFVRTDYAKYLGDMLDSKLYIVILTRRLEPVVLNRITFPVWILLGVSNINSIHSENQSSVIWNGLNSADSKKLKNIRRHFANLCYTPFIQLVCF